MSVRTLSVLALASLLALGCLPKKKTKTKKADEPPVEVPSESEPPSSDPAPSTDPPPNEGPLPCANDCDDDNACTIDSCVDGECVHTALSCADGNECTADSCDPAVGCIYAATTGECDDGDWCTLDDACTAGTCAGTPMDCDDGNECTSDTCVPGEGCIVEDLDGDPCDDGNPCTLDDACEDRYCKGTWDDCEDGNECTDDWCEDGEGCVNPVHNGKGCDDGDACTSGEFCWDGACVEGKAVPCDDGNPCTTDACDGAGGCTSTPAAGPCDDGNPCTTGDACAGGGCAGAPKSCDDGNPCTADSCDSAGNCQHVAKIGATCDDGNACTTGDACTSAGACDGTPIGCDDGNDCTADACDPGVGCTSTVEVGAGCDDGSACTTGDACTSAGTCAGSTVDCADGNECTADSCDAATGCVNAPQAGMPCDDGSACTSGDACTSSGACAGADVSCDDGDACTADSCVASAGCVNSPSSGGACDDGSACTTGDTCVAGACQGKILACDDGDPCTADSCDTATGCVNAPSSGATCDDGSACTTGDTCVAGTCQGKTLDCDDGNACTTDACEASTGCQSTPNDGATCDDGNACTSGDTCSGGSCGGEAISCDDGNPCTADSCEASTGCQSTPNDGATCDDGNACTSGDTCVAGSCAGEAISCDDGNPCTADSCQANSGCKHTPNDGATCDDGNACTSGDTCVAGGCGGEAITCDDGNPCTTTACDPKTGCTAKDVADGTPCDDGSVCTVVPCESPIAEHYAVWNAKGTPVSITPASNHGFVFTNFFGNQNAAFTFLPGSTFDVMTDGSAVLHAKLELTGGPAGRLGETWEAELSWSYRGMGAAGQGYGGPKKELIAGHQPASVTDAWRYYDLTSGTLSRVGSGDYAVLTQSPADGKFPFQLGDTASGKNKNFGGSQWYLFVHHAGGGVTSGIGDINADMVPADVPPCEGTDQCQAGTCTGEPISCDDGNPCTTDTCEAKAGCVNENADGASCDDGDACTAGDTCGGGACAGDAVSCDDGNPCTTDACHAGSGCSNSPADGAGCDDGTTCTEGDVCSGGACSGKSISCDDGNPCTTDACDAELGCIHTNTDGKACDDGTACTTGDVCSGGTCAGVKISCDDGNPCTTDSCAAGSGCVHVNADGKSCDDGNACTTADTCGGGACAGAAVDCDDGNPCTTSSCDPSTGCAAKAVADGTPCDDGNACTVVECDSPVAERFQVWNAVGSGNNHGLWLPDFFGNQLTEMTFEPGATFDVLKDGTAVMTATVTVTTGPSGRIGEKWEAHLTWTYRGQGPDGEGWGGPKKELGSQQLKSVTDQWRYFDLTSGTLYRVGSSHWASLTQSPADSKFPFQIGIGANGKNLSFGGSQWFLYVHHKGSKIRTGKGDINCELESVDLPPCESTDQCQAGVCGGDPVSCDDGDACTDNWCDPEDGCMSESLATDEICDGQDNDCDGAVDEGFGVGATCDTCDGEGVETLAWANDATERPVIVGGKGFILTGSTFADMFEHNYSGVDAYIDHFLDLLLVAAPADTPSVLGFYGAYDAGDHAGMKAILEAFQDQGFLSAYTGMDVSAGAPLDLTPADLAGVDVVVLDAAPDAHQANFFVLTAGAYAALEDFVAGGGVIVASAYTMVHWNNYLGWQRHLANTNLSSLFGGVLPDIHHFVDSAWTTGPLGDGTLLKTLNYAKPNLSSKSDPFFHFFWALDLSNACISTPGTVTCAPDGTTTCD